MMICRKNCLFHRMLATTKEVGFERPTASSQLCSAGSFSRDHIILIVLCPDPASPTHDVNGIDSLCTKTHSLHRTSVFVEYINPSSIPPVDIVSSIFAAMVAHTLRKKSCGTSSAFLLAACHAHGRSLSSFAKFKQGKI